jgi:hypothetical protein
MKPLRIALALLLSLALLANGWAATRLHGVQGAAAEVTVLADDAGLASDAAAPDAQPPCHASASPTAAPDAPPAGAGCCGPLCQHLCGLMLVLLPPALAAAPSVPVAAAPQPVAAVEPFASHAGASLWRPPRG